MCPPIRALMLLLAAISIGRQSSTVFAQSGEPPASPNSISEAQRRDEREILQGVITHLLTNDRLASTRQRYAIGDRKLAWLSSNSPVPWPLDDPPTVDGWEIRKGSTGWSAQPISLDIQALEVWNPELETWRVAIRIGRIKLNAKPFARTVYYEARRRGTQWDVEFLGGGKERGEPHDEESVAQWRRIYAFRSLRHRLAFEGTGLAVPPAQRKTAKKVDQDSAPVVAFFPNWQWRYSESLRKLHYDKVEDFVARDGFGLSRVLPAGPDYIHEMQTNPVPVHAAGSEPYIMQSEPSLALDPQDAPSGSNTLRGPSLQSLREYNRDAQDLFVDNSVWMYFESVDRVAGFEPHRLPMAPRIGYEPSRYNRRPASKSAAEEYWKYPLQKCDYWIVTRLQLVSLLKNSRPAVYVSSNLPAMKELNRASTRDLDQFETSALAELSSGEEIVAEARLNHVRLLGAVRARKTCLRCHSGEVGDLLGAFTYDLQRDPLMAVDQPLVTTESPASKTPNSEGAVVPNGKLPPRR